MSGQTLKAAVQGSSINIDWFGFRQIFYDQKTLSQAFPASIIASIEELMAGSGPGRQSKHTSSWQNSHSSGQVTPERAKEFYQKQQAWFEAAQSLDILQGKGRLDGIRLDAPMLRPLAQVALSQLVVLVGFVMSNRGLTLLQSPQTMPANKNKRPETTRLGFHLEAHAKRPRKIKRVAIDGVFEVAFHLGGHWLNLLCCSGEARGARRASKGRCMSIQVHAKVWPFQEHVFRTLQEEAEVALACLSVEAMQRTCSHVLGGFSRKSTESFTESDAEPNLRAELWMRADL